MAKHIHIHLHRKSRDADVYSEYEKWADVRGKDKRSLVTITAFVRATGANPNVENMLRDRYMKNSDAGFTKYDPREARKLDERIADLEVEARSESGERRQKTLEEIAALKRERAKYHADDAYRGTFTVEVPIEEFGRYKVREGSTMQYRELRVHVARVVKEPARKSPSGEMFPERALVTMETLDNKAKDSKLEDLEQRLEELETQIEKLEDTGQSPTRALLDKRKEIQGAIAVIKSARKAD